MDKPHRRRIGSVRLAEEADFDVGPLHVRPSRGEFEHLGAVKRLEPRLMQVLVVLGRAKGQTVSRQELIDRCWNGVITSPDAVNRTISLLRRLIGTNNRHIRIETLPRIGYRLVSNRENRSDLESMIDSIARDLYSRAMFCLEQPSREPIEQAVTYLKEVVARDGAFAPGWATLAEAQRLLMLHFPPQAQGPACAECRSSAERALALDSNLGQPYGTLANLVPRFGNWAEVEQLLLKGLENGPTSPILIHHYAQFLMSVGRTGEALERLTDLYECYPLNAAIAVDLAAALSDAGHIEKALSTISHAYALWPATPLVWSECVRLHVISDRFDRAEAMLRDPPAAIGPDDPNIARRLLHLEARRYRRAAEISAAVENFIGFSRLGVAPAIIAVHALGALEQPEAALSVADEIYTPDTTRSRQPGLNMMCTVTLAGEPDSAVLFRRETATMRRSPGFDKIIDRIGLREYWEQSNVAPDFLARGGAAPKLRAPAPEGS